MKVLTRAKVIALDSPPPLPLQQALENFEQQFTYPLGAAGSFRIEHGQDYSGFCRAMGTGRSFIVEKDNEIKAAIGTSIRTLDTPQGKVQAAYICDLKTNPNANCGRALLSCMEAALIWCRPQAQAAYGVVMDGTVADPAVYSGRFGIPHFSPVARVAVLQVSLAPLVTSAKNNSIEIVSEWAARQQFAALANGYVCTSGTPIERSRIEPLWFASEGASGCLEDTRRVKRLIRDNGSEIVAAHLSNFAYSDVDPAASMIETAAARAANQNFQCLFVSVPLQDSMLIVQALTRLKVMLASATIYAHSPEQVLIADSPWFIHSSEI